MQTSDVNPMMGVSFFKPILLKVFVYFMLISCCSLIIFLFPVVLSHDFFAKFFSNLYSVTFILLAAISYYRACNLPSVALQLPDVPNFEPIQNQDRCLKCPNKPWKPERTHHCSACGTCVTKMDHHCPWVGGCVGYHNHKSFFLLNFYMCASGLYYCYLYLCYYLYLRQDGADQPEPWLLCFCQIISYIAITVTALTSCLTIFHFLFAMSNVTTVEMFGGAALDIPCYPRPSKTANVYNLGRLANLAEFFHRSTFLWWWPTSPEDYDEGYRFKKVALCTEFEYDYLVNKIDVYIDRPVNQGGSQLKRREIDVNKMLNDAEKSVSSKILKFGDLVLNTSRSINNTSSLFEMQKISSSILS